ncbi:MAG: PBP1A family penicillin-binding protein [Hyphomicrobiales bacterium]|nr:PBP1A family penicillin-binding protein [Hyphomicrobiales bacterium]
MTGGSDYDFWRSRPLAEKEDGFYTDEYAVKPSLLSRSLDRVKQHFFDGWRRAVCEASFQVLAWVAVAAAFVSLILVALVYYYSVTLPDSRHAGITKTPPNLTILAQDGRFIAERGMRRGYVAYADLPPHLVNAAIAAEDRRFRYHFGFDPIGMARAALRNWRAGRVVEGGSTITQQLAKNLFLTSRRTWTRKVEEVIVSLWLEHRYTKDEIAELYFNRVYFGAGNYGVGAAAYHYFGKHARDLTLAESGLLVGLIKAPSQYSPMFNLKGARDRARTVLKSMAEAEMIGLEDYGLAVAQPASFQKLPSTPGFEHLVDWIVELVPQLAGEIEANIIVETSVDADLQEAAWAALREVMERMGASVHASEAAVVALSPDGRLRALIGGMDYQSSQFNRAVNARRQPGSAFKPFIYLSAIERGYTPDDVIRDAPVQVGAWTPGNYEGIYRGQISLRRALADSSNMAAVRLTSDIGLSQIIATARRLGITTELRAHPTLALGASDVTLLEMAGAYASFANGGFGVAPQVIDRIRDENGNVLYSRSTAAPYRVIAEGHVAAMNDMMHAVVENGTGSGGALPGQIVAAKTGTSQRYRDAWFVGFTPYYIGGVWMGNDNNWPMRNVTGGSLPAEVWRRMMLKAHEGLEAMPMVGVRRTLIAGPVKPAVSSLAAKHIPAAPPAADKPRPGPRASASYDRRTVPKSAMRRSAGQPQSPPQNGKSRNVASPAQQGGGNSGMFRATGRP